MAKLFVSYRRQDSAYVALTLKERLERHFGENSVFFDIDNIPLGGDFRKYIEMAVEQCDVLLVLIGDGWLAVQDNKVQNRLFEPRDYVRIEIEAGLRRGIPVIPVLVENAQIPRAEDVPESIQDLIFRNSAELRAGRDFYDHMTRLVESLSRLLDSQAATPAAPALPATPAAAPTSVALVDTRVEPPARKPRARQAERVTEEKRKRPSPPPLPASKDSSAAAAISADADVRDAILQTFANLPKAFTESNIPASKLQNALAAYAPKIQQRQVVLLYDDTVWGSAKNGFVLTRTGLYWCNLMQTPAHLAYDTITSVELNQGMLTHAVNVNGHAVDMTELTVGQALVRFLDWVKNRQSAS